MLRKNKTKSLYDKAIEKKNENIEKERIYKNLNLDKDKNTIVFDKKTNTGIKVLNFIAESVGKIIKFLVILVVLVLLTIGATVLINPGLRDNLLEILNNFNFLT